MRRAALNSDGRATIHGFLLANVRRRARPPSLMLAPFARSHRHAIAGLRKSRPACLSLHPRANHAAPCSNVTVPIHPATTFNGFLARRCRRGNLVAARLDRETVSAASFRFSALHETVRPHSQDRQWADTPAISLRARLRCAPCCPCRTPPDAPPDHRGVSINGRALPRRARRIPATRN